MIIRYTSEEPDLQVPGKSL